MSPPMADHKPKSDISFAGTFASSAFAACFAELMLDGEILHAAPYHELLASNRKFQYLVNAHKETAGSERLVEVASPKKSKTPAKEIKKTHIEKKSKASEGDQLIKQEEREVGDIGLKPYTQYLNQNRGY